MTECSGQLHLSALLKPACSRRKWLGKTRRQLDNQGAIAIAVSISKQNQRLRFQGCAQGWPLYLDLIFQNHQITVEIEPHRSGRLLRTLPRNIQIVQQINVTLAQAPICRYREELLQVTLKRSNGIALNSPVVHMIRLRSTKSAAYWATADQAKLATTDAADSALKKDCFRGHTGQ